MNRPAIAAALIGLTALSGCRAYNYQSPEGPRYAGAVPPAPRPAALVGSRPLRVVTFNVQYARRIDRAIRVLESTPGLRDADVIVLQEMDAPGTQRIASALAMGYVYYPGAVHSRTQRDFGNAILSRWPIITDGKLLLPHPGGLRCTQRIATAATVLVDGAPVRVYSVHLGSPMEIGHASRRDQVRVILADAAAHSRVIVGGDLNSRGVGKEFRAAGYIWPTADNPKTHMFFNWDHVLFKGFAPADHAGAGVVRDTLRTSDHDPVWAVAVLAPPAK